MMKKLIQKLFGGCSGEIKPSHTPNCPPKLTELGCIAQSILNDLYKDGWFISSINTAYSILENKRVNYYIWNLCGTFSIREKRKGCWEYLDLYPDEYNVLEKKYQEIINTNKSKALHERQLKKEASLKRLFPHCYERV